VTENVTTETWIELYWLPLGAGGHFVRWNGRVYEALAARRQHRAPVPLYHSAMQIRLGDIVYAVEMGPVWNVSAPERGVVCEGPVGARRLGRFRAFRYEVRCWPGGNIPDFIEAVDGPVRITDDPARAADVLQILPRVPPLTWGRDELGTGDMWNSNSVVAGALASTGHDLSTVVPPRGGRAPGWQAGLALARQLVNTPVAQA
jgi:hypothetical protein